MSNYCWESGTITIPSACWASFKKAIRDALNRQSEKEYQMSLSLFNEVLAKGKGKRKFNFYSVCEELLRCDYRYRNADSSEILNRLFPKEIGAGVKPNRPLKKDYKKYTNKDLSFWNDDATLSLNDKHRTAYWDVAENNHAIEEARSSSLGVAFFSALNNVKWTRKSGGQIVGNDEYRRDCQFDGGGSNYVTATYPPAQRKRQSGYYFLGR